MAGIKTIAKGRQDFYRLAVEDIHVKPGWNAREDEDPANIEHVAQLARSIAAVGQKTPIKIYLEDEKAFVSDGYSRLKAIKYAIKEFDAQIATVNCIVEDKYSSEADRVFTMIVGNSGKPLTPLETGRVFKRLIDFNWSEKDIADKSGMSTQRVRDLLELQAGPAEVVDMVAKGQVTATLAQTVVRANKGDRKAAVQTLTDAIVKAKVEGKTKATAKHVGTGKSLKEEMKAIFAAATPIMGGYMINDADYAKAVKSLNIKAT